MIKTDIVFYFNTNDTREQRESFNKILISNTNLIVYIVVIYSGTAIFIRTVS